MYEEIVTGFSAPISIGATLAPLLGDNVKKVAWPVIYSKKLPN